MSAIGAEVEIMSSHEIIMGRVGGTDLDLSACVSACLCICPQAETLYVTRYIVYILYGNSLDQALSDDFVDCLVTLTL